MATPQWATAQFGSLAITSRNVFSAAEYAKECKSATARSNSGWTSAEQDVRKCTVPSLSGTGCSWFCAITIDCEFGRAKHTSEKDSPKIAHTLKC